MKIPQKIYYQYVADRKNTTCKICVENDGEVFFDENIPKLPIHQNCNCKLKPINEYKGELPDLSGVNYSEWYTNVYNNRHIKSFKYASYPWIKVPLSKEVYILYNMDADVLITFDDMKTVKYK